MIQFFQSISRLPSQASPVAQDIFLQIHGQSNARANTIGSTPNIEYQGDIDGGFIYNNNQWEVLNYPNNNDTNTSSADFFGIECVFSKLNKDQFNKNTWIGKKAIGGTIIDENPSFIDWNPNSNEYITNIIEQANNLKNKYIELGSPENAKHIFYSHWGEGDANLGNTDFYGDFISILNVINNIFPIDLCIVPVLNDNVQVTTANIGNIQAQQRQLATDIDYIENVEMNQFTLRAGGLHYTAQDQQVLATQIFNIYKSKFNL